MSSKVKKSAIVLGLLFVFGVVSGVLGGFSRLGLAFPPQARAKNPFLGATSGYGSIPSSPISEQYEKNLNKYAQHKEAVINAKSGKASVNSLTGEVATQLEVAIGFMLGGDPTVTRTRNNSGSNPNSSSIISQQYGGGVLGNLNTGILAFYKNPAATSGTYIADIMESAKIIPPAQAQGLGFASLDPILETWKIFRNVAYLAFVIIFLVIGFMIMFRQKIGGQTVVTAQQAIPSIITALLFVTFSYAIAGLLIDFMYLFMYLIIGLFSGSQSLINSSFLELGFKLLTGSGFNDSLYGTVSGSVQTFLTDGFNLPEGLGWLGGVTFGLIILIAVVIGIFKLFFELLKTYVSIIAWIAFAPLFLMAGAIPGRNVFGEWIRNIIGNLSAFPTTLLLLIMYDKMTSANIGQGGFMPPYLIGQGQSGAITVLVGIGIILIMPEAVKKVKETLGVKDGIFTQFAKDAVANAKKGWSGEGVRGWGAKKMLGGAIASPLAVGGAYFGQKYEADQARKLGLSDRGVNIARVAGTFLGGASGIKAPQIIKSMGGTGLRETRDAIMKTQVDKYAGLFEEKLKTKKVTGETGVAKDVGSATQIDPTSEPPTYNPHAKPKPPTNRRFRP